MRAYLRYSYISLKEYLAYPVSILADLSSGFIYLFMQISLWSALFMGNERHNGMNFSQTIKYIAAATVISAIMECDIINRLNELIRDGSITNDLLRPVDFRLIMLCKQLGQTFIKALLIALPTFLFAVFLISGNPFSSGCLLWGILSVILAYAIHFLYSLVIGMLAFFLIVTWPLNMLLGAFYKLLSGMWIPVSMFPKLLYSINLFLPFRAVYAIPLSILTGAETDISGSILIQVLWLIVFFVLAEFVWKKGYKKLIVQGG